MADEAITACECPDYAESCVGDPSTDFSRRHRHSISDSVDESQLYHVVSGPFTFEEEELNKDEGRYGTGLSTFSVYQEQFSMVTDQARNGGHTSHLIEPR